MLTQYQIRNPKTDGVFIGFDTSIEAIHYWHETVEHAKPKNLIHGAVVVKYTAETRAEAETARLDYLLSKWSFDEMALALLKIPYSTSDRARAAIDLARKAPKPQTEVIWPKPAEPKQNS